MTATVHKDLPYASYTDFISALAKDFPPEVTIQVSGTEDALVINVIVKVGSYVPVKEIEVRGSNLSAQTLTEKIKESLVNQVRQIYNYEPANA